MSAHCLTSRSRARGRSLAGSVKVRFVRPSCTYACTMTSTTMPASASGLNTFAWMPGSSEIPCRVILASSLRGGDAGDHDCFHGFLLGHDPGPFVVVEARTDVDRHAVLHPELDRADLQHLGAQRRQLQHLLVADAVDLARGADDVGVGGVDAVDVGVDLARRRP